MIFDWDEDKNLKNFRKHGVLFDEAKTLWRDLSAIDYLDDIYLVSEERYIRVGLSIKLRLLAVVFCENDQVVRIISCRKATHAEEKMYEKRI